MDNQQQYTLAQEDECWIIRRQDGSIVFTLTPEDHKFAQEILTNLNSDTLNEATSVV